VIEASFIEETRKTLPELPDAKAERFKQQYKLSAYDAGVLTATRAMADYYEQVVRDSGADPRSPPTGGGGAVRC